MRNALVVADDLTGAMDTGHGFAERGWSVRVCRSDAAGSADATDDRDVLVVDTDSRDADPDAAATAVTRAVAANPTDLVYKKVDSTLRGNVVTEVDAAVGAAAADIAVVAPAFPETGRTTEDGRHFVDGTPLAEAGYGVADSDLREYFAASESPVAHLDTDTVDAGAAAVAERLGDHVGSERPTLVVCDARTDDHLEAVAAGAASLAEMPLYVGSGGLAGHVEVPGDPPDGTTTADATPSTDPRSSGVLGVVGSVNERTLAQLAAVDDEAVVALDPAAAVREPERAGRAAAESLSALLDWQGRAVATAATERADVSAAERAAAELGGDATAADRVAAALAAAARATVEASPPAGLVLTGGDTAGAVLDALDAEAIDLAGESVAAGVPQGRIATGPAAGTQVVTKAGGFGTERVILNCLDALGR